MALSRQLKILEAAREYRAIYLRDLCEVASDYHAIRSAALKLESQRLIQLVIGPYGIIVARYGITVYPEEVERLAIASS